MTGRFYLFVFLAVTWGIELFVVENNVAWSWASLVCFLFMSLCAVDALFVEARAAERDRALRDIIQRRLRADEGRTP